MTEFIYKLVENKEELQNVNEVKRQVFVIEQGIDEELVFESAKDSDEINIVAKNKDIVIGTARVVFPTNDTAKIERMAVIKSFRGRGIGKGIISFLEGELKKRKIKNVILHAQYQVVNFYKTCGFRESGLPFEEAGIKHVKMEM